jgi:hypothetical protein
MNILNGVLLVYQSPLSETNSDTADDGVDDGWYEKER